MGRKNLEMYFNMGNEDGSGHMKVVDAENVDLCLNETVEASGLRKWTGMLGKDLGFSLGDLGMFRARVQYALLEGLEMDDPIAFPTVALLAAKAGKHSSGSDLADIEAVLKSLLSAGEYAFVVKLTEKLAHPTGVVDWANRVEGARVDRAAASAYPRPRR